MRQFQRTAISLATAHVAVMWTGIAMAQAAPVPEPAASAPTPSSAASAPASTASAPAAAASAPANAASAPAAAAPSETKPQQPTGKPEVKLDTVIISGRRAALETAQRIKQDADEVVDSIVAEDIGKLPDRSVTEVLQRVVGVTIDRNMSRSDPEHFSVEGSGVNIRGLSYVRSELNGRDTFSANGGRSLNFEDVPPELMAGVDVYKNPSAVQIEGAIGGLVNLRTFMPFDFTGFKGTMSLQGNYTEAQRKTSPAGTVLLSDRWDSDFGQFGALLSLAHSVSTTRTDEIQVDPYFKIDPTGGTNRTQWVPKGMSWRTNEYERTRDGLYSALQWKKNDLSSSLSYFESKYKMHWDESAIFGQTDPWNIAVDGGTYTQNNVMTRGSLREATARDGGINFGADTRSSNRDSGTKELAWNLKWKANERWSFNTDVQLIRSKTESFDSTVATGVLMPKETLDLTGSMPRIAFDSSDMASLADPSKYYWGSMQDHADKSKANSKAWRGDAKFMFEDPVLIDLQFGVRLTDRDATTTTSMSPYKTAYNWSAITQPWMKGWYLDNMAMLSDPRFSGGTYTHQFGNFFGGSAAVPGLILPTVAMARGYPDSYATLNQYSIAMCQERNARIAATPNSTESLGTCNGFWTPSTFGVDPAGTNDQHETTQAAYAQLRFGFDDWKFPVDGNIGMRLVRTHMEAKGYTILSVASTGVGSGQTLGGVAIPGLSTFASPIDFEQTYTNVLPSLNLRMKASSQLQFRLGLAQAIARPDFSDLQAYSTLDMSYDKHSETIGGKSQLIIDRVKLTGTAQGNPALKPTKSDQIDLTSEWNFSKTGSFTVAVFNKQLKDVIVKQTSTVQLTDSSGTPVNFTATAPVNGAKGFARGFEVAYQQYFDKLPGALAGFGVQANYTFVHSKTKPYQSTYTPLCSGTSTDAVNLNLNSNGCDTDGRTFGDLPLTYLSRDTYNLALLYDRGPLSARVAYNWRSKYLQGVNVNGTNGGNGQDDAGKPVAYALPTWSDAYGTLDAGVSYSITDNLKVSLEGKNLTNEANRQLMQQHIGMMLRGVSYTGRQYSASMSYSY